MNNIINFIKEVIQDIAETLADKELINNRPELLLAVGFFAIVGVLIAWFIIAFIIGIGEIIISGITYSKEKKLHKERLVKIKDFKNDEKVKKDESKQKERRLKINEKLKKKYSPEELGKLAEDECANELKKINGMDVYRNVIFYTDDENQLTECDMIGVSDKAIYFFEVKSYSGCVGISDKKYWRIYGYNDEFKFFKNSPALQNKGHAKFFKALAKEKGIDLKELHFNSFIVFSDRTVLFKEPESCENILKENVVCNVENLLELVKKREDRFEKPIQNKEEIKAFISKYTNVPDRIKEKQLSLAMSKENTVI